jgi:pilus assembly protein TadC
MSAILIGCLVAAAAVLLAVPVGRPRPARRLAKLPIPVGDGGAAAQGRRRVDLTRLTAGLCGIAVVMLLSGWFGVLAGVTVAIGLDCGLRRLAPAARNRERRLAEAAELPLAADLLAVTLRGGAPVDHATAAVAEALPGPLGDQLARVARALRLGGTPAEAWAHLDTGGGGTGAARLVRAAVRSAEHGSALAGALGRLADDLRADRTIAVEAAARRAAVLIVLPLGLCFLPAFILAGLVPVIVAILGDVL